MLPQKYINKHLTDNNLYDPSKSKTWSQATDKIFNITYDVGELGASGLVGTETVELGGATITTMLVGAATNMFGRGIIDTVYDGTMGLGWQSGNSIQTIEGQSAPGPTFMQAIQSQLEQPVFTADFRGNSGESLSFGFIDHTLYTGSLNTIAVDNSTSFWSISGVKFSSGGKQLGESDGISVLMDTGGTATTVSTDVAKDYWSQVSSATFNGDDEIWSFDCSTADLPDLTFNFAEGSSATIPGTVLNVSSSDNGDGTCAGGIQGTANGLPNAGYGFFNRYFTAWNQAVPHIQFAPYSSKVEKAGVNDANLPTATDEPGIPVATDVSSSSSSSSSSTSSTSSNSGGSSISGSTGVADDPSSSSSSSSSSVSSISIPASSPSSSGSSSGSSSSSSSSDSSGSSSSSSTNGSGDSTGTAAGSAESATSTPVGKSAAVVIGVPQLGLSLSVGFILLNTLALI